MAAEGKPERTSRMAGSATSRSPSPPHRTRRIFFMRVSARKASPPPGGVKAGCFSRKGKNDEFRWAEVFSSRPKKTWAYYTKEIRKINNPHHPAEGFSASPQNGG